MELDKVRKAVLDDARHEAERIESEAQRRAEEEFHRARRDLESEHQAALAQAQARIGEKVALDVQRVRTEKARQILARKNQLIDEVFDRALAQLTSMPEDQYGDMLVDWLLACAGEGEARVAFNRKDRPSVAVDVLRRANEHLGRDSLTLAEDALHASGGFVLRTPTYELDRTFETQIRILRKEMIAEIASKLFAS